jgi:hypothetical protein
MEPATESRPGRRLSAFLAGLQAGMLGALVYLSWMGVTAVWRRLSFWTAPNLMASVFYGGDAIHRGFAFVTVAGIAFCLVLYSFLGASFAVITDGRLPRLRLTLVSVVVALAWYYLAFRLLSKSAAPLVALLHVETTTIIGHAIFGAVLGRYPAHMPKKKC